MEHRASQSDDRRASPTSAAQDQGTVQPPAIALPKGGGAVRGMGEKFAANPVTGTGSMTVPMATSPGLSGFGPQLSLSYDSGSGNGPFGFGWSLSVPAVTRKTDKGLPQYLDDLDSDVFLLSGAEDLVPVYRQNADGAWALDQAGGFVVHEEERDGYRIRRYRPRIEGLFARIERWTRLDPEAGQPARPLDVHWRSISKDNILTLYGRDASSRIHDPADPGRIFSWLISETRDDKGNAVVYDYAAENGFGIDLAQANEHNRGASDDPRRTANRYLKRIRYGNHTPLLDDQGRRPLWLENARREAEPWMFEIVLDYGEHDQDAPKPIAAPHWPCRPDPFSGYRAGFEVRTYRLCQRVLMFHHFPDEQGVGKDCLVRSTDFTYAYEQDPTSARNPVYSFLQSVTQNGYRRREEGGYLKRSLPPLEFEYSQPTVQDKVETIDPASLEHLPIGVDGSLYQWTDLHGEGIPGVLTEQGGAWHYRRNLSPIADGRVELGPVERVPIRPNLSIASGQAQFMDLAGDGQPDLVVLDGPTPGLYEHDAAEGWQPFRPFTNRLNRDTRDPNLKLIDLDGDGHADILISEDDAFVWHASLAESGFGPARRVSQALDEEKGPRLVFADASQSIYLADLSGDGLTDLARIRNGEVCYWPNLGHGRFGAKVTMDHAPRFDQPDQFDQRRIRLADIDGSGTTDILYLHRDGLRLYFNQSGNAWSEPQTLTTSPRVDSLVDIAVADLLGNGTACLTWSSPLPGDSGRQMRYVDLMGGHKPHLLVRTANNLGAETRVGYVPSTKFYLQDKRDGRPWITRLPFPVHVVERVETFDHISRNRFVSRYAYHHGYFDGEEREFRGFGMVEQWDTEAFATLADGQTPAANIAAESHVPPVHTKTWFHTGVYLGRHHVSDYFAGLLDAHDTGEYYREPGLNDAQARALLLDDTVLPDGLSVEEEREACRALKGSMLRQEVYALDGTDKAPHPYSVTEQSFSIRVLQPRGSNRHAVFFAHAREAISCHYERNPADPRIQHALTLEVDAFGNVLKQAAIGYGRRQPDPDLPAQDAAKQTRTLVTYTENRVTNALPNALQAADDYRAPLPCETLTYELTGLAPENHAARFSFAEWTRDGFALPTSAVEIPYDQTASPATPQKRLIERLRTRYRRDDLTGLLPLGELQPLALPGETYKLAFTPGLLTEHFGAQSSSAELTAILHQEGGYVDLDQDGHAWIPSGRIFYTPDPSHTPAQELALARQNGFLPQRFEDPFAQATMIGYDAHRLLVEQTTDALGNTVRAENDYRVLQPALVTDPNGNRSQVAFDVLGMVVGTAVMGKLEEQLGDSLEDFQADLTEAAVREHLQRPLANPHAILGRATTRLVYDLFAYQRSQDQPEPQPPVVYTLVRETHDADLPPGARTKVQHSFSYSDGFGREIQKKIQAEPGPGPQRDADGRIQVGADGQPKLTADDISPRWVGSGWTVFNNKGKPVRQYEPFFTDTHHFELDVRIGVSPVLFYDPLERVIATLHPNHSFEKVLFNPWRQVTYDVNDTCAPAGAQTGDPRTDPDIGGYVAAYFETQSANWQTWYAERQGGALGADERQAAAQAAAHADTPTTAYLDTLGRPFLTVAHNKVACPGHALDGTEEHPHTRVELDIEGNQREVIDAKGRVVMRYHYDLLGTRIRQQSMEAGERWMLNDVTGKPIRAWDSRGFQRRMAYDALRRPTGLYVSDNGQAERLAEKTLYGDTPGALSAPEQTNHRGKPYQVYDDAGIVTSESYDFKGNLLKSRRQLRREYKLPADWGQEPELEAETFRGSTRYDALNRVIQMVAPHSDQEGAKRNILRPGYNEANLLERVDGWLQRSEAPDGLLDPQTADQPFVRDIDYDAKGQRTRIEYGNGAVTSYEYDPLTFRLTRLETTRQAQANGFAQQIFKSAGRVQDLRYTYDPAGNITRIADESLRVVHHGNQLVQPVGRYTYDALYRLIEAQGREHIGQSAFQLNPPDGNYRDHPFAGLGAQSSDPTALRGYSERYVYDAVGNFLSFQHQANGGNWQRDYAYVEPSLVKPSDSAVSNRLSRTILHPNGAQPVVEPYAHDAHGNMTRMPHLPLMDWDFKDQLHASSRQVVNNGGTPETTYYVYDAAGQRVRKVTESYAPSGETPTLRKERIYLGGFEIYREYDGGGENRTKERESLHVMDDKQRIALVETTTLGAETADDLRVPVIRYQLGNHLGSASLELDRDGGLISYEEYHPYGTTAFQAGRSLAEISLKRYRYTGKERDEETGFNYHGARYYAVWLGRWCSCDPLGTIGEDSLYVYTRNSPINLTDLQGRQPTVAPTEEIPLLIGEAPLIFSQSEFERFQEDYLPKKQAALTDYHRRQEGAQKKSSPPKPREVPPSQRLESGSKQPNALAEVVKLVYKGIEEYYPKAEFEMIRWLHGAEGQPAPIPEGMTVIGFKVEEVSEYDKIQTYRAMALQSEIDKEKIESALAPYLQTSGQTYLGTELALGKDWNRQHPEMIGLEQFARNVGALDYHRWPEHGLYSPTVSKSFLAAFTTAMDRTRPFAGQYGGRIHIELEGVDWGQVRQLRRGANPYDVGYTEWEVYEVLRRDDLANRARFYMRGEPLNISTSRTMRYMEYSASPRIYSTIRVPSRIP